MLVETAKGPDQPKDHAWIKRLAERADLPAALVFYKPGETIWCETCGRTYVDLVSVTVRDVWPLRSGSHQFTGDEWADEIETLHRDHQCLS